MEIPEFISDLDMRAVALTLAFWMIPLYACWRWDYFMESFSFAYRLIMTVISLPVFYIVTVFSLNR